MYYTQSLYVYLNFYNIEIWKARLYVAYVIIDKKYIIKSIMSIMSIT